MKIINKIEINYFRSVYSLSLPNIEDMGVLIGGNDSGKSNILKALNLFFNNETEIDNDLDFLEDLNKFRGQEVREVKGRATIWVKITFRNAFNWRSLPNEFSIKRTWNRYDDFPHQDVFPNIPNPTIGRFLNRIDFHYIPAVRSREIFSRYLGLLHDSLIEDEDAGLRNASNALVERINEDIEEMSSEIGQKLGFSSNIDIPEDFRNLFEALDFSTSYSRHKIALQRRGDGIQARHIPFILNFLSKRSKRTHIWAYEEPENSLEFSNAFRLSEQFQTEFTNQSQIFITTHSPAFYDAHKCPVSKWLIRNEAIEDRYETRSSEVDEKHLPDTELGLSVLLRDRAKELNDQINDLRKSNEHLQGFVNEATKAVVIVEGKTDRYIIESAKDKYRSQLRSDFDIIEAGNADKVLQFVKSISESPVDARFPVIGILDNDWEGRRRIKNFSKYAKYPGTRFRTINKKRAVYIGTLGVPEPLEEVFKSFNQFKGDDGGAWLTIEYMFPPDVIQQAIDSGALCLEDVIYDHKINGMNIPNNLTDTIKTILPEQYWYFAKKISDQSKKNFAEFVV